ncbi:uncharacterized protein PODANS_2_6985 [Podospora anserina S mat+]|uniref:Podospora anserina S mat+ genomic DNA chromosome 2, supercontig 2 n=1 Tax=Podospora anserina (strain S / ATCC MYA-4624 / DSM 980 / FGSC 10383) TaxID=515849 RepID=B2B679_PODAN|nr:uncharacterized protein PODANS_2_6985 [Podospora anserina S mat+]CAP73304.1 unnamed protein product [Podospora anserina S mat+]CDP25707.1 Putative protein of unknown function [Podospora anserina S mat+]
MVFQVWNDQTKVSSLFPAKNSWNREDRPLSSIHSLFSDISKLSIYGNLDVKWTWHGPGETPEHMVWEEPEEGQVQHIEQRACTVQDFIPVLKEFKNLKQLVITDEQMARSEVMDLPNVEKRAANAHEEVTRFSKLVLNMPEVTIREANNQSWCGASITSGLTH